MLPTARTVSVLARQDGVSRGHGIPGLFTGTVIYPRNIHGTKTNGTSAREGERFALRLFTLCFVYWESDWYLVMKDYRLSQSISLI